MSNYKVWSSDNHIMEPADLWTERIDPKFKDRAPRIVRENGNDKWYCEGQPFGNIGSNQQAGQRFEDPSKINREGVMDTVRLGGVDPDAHVVDLDVDGVQGGVLYPSQGLTLWGIPPSDLLSAIFRAYNDYLASFCSPHPNRLKGIAMVNVDSVSDAVSELERIRKIGLAGAMISIEPILPYKSPEYEPLWAAAQDLDIPLSLHTGTHRWRPGKVITNGVNFVLREIETRQCINDMIMTGVFERYPKLDVGAVEFEISWAPFFMDSMDYAYKDLGGYSKGYQFKNDAVPSDFFRQNIFISFQEDDVGIQIRHYVGVKNLMWGSDYPHAESTFPKSREILDRILDGVPEDEQAQIAGSNLARLYHFE